MEVIGKVISSAAEHGERVPTRITFFPRPSSPERTAFYAAFGSGRDLAVVAAGSPRPRERSAGGGEGEESPENLQIVPVQEAEDELPNHERRDFWMPDKVCKMCYDCETPFTALQRRHHCRVCGNVFCTNCTANEIPAGIARGAKVRCCQECFKLCQEFERQEKAKASKAKGNAHGKGKGKKGKCVEEEEENGGDGEECPKEDEEAIASLSLLGGMEENDHVKFRNHSEANLQVLAPEPLSHNTPPLGPVPSVPLPAPPLADEGEGLGRQAPAKGGEGEAFVIPAPCAKPSDIPQSRPDTARKMQLRELGQAWFEACVRQLVEGEGLDRLWAGTIARSARAACDLVSLDNAQPMDIRHYVQVKRLPGGAEPCCKVVRGVLFRKHTAYRQAPKFIVRPRILLVGTSLEFVRAPRFTNIELILTEEDEAARLLVQKILRYKPNVILVRQSVSRKCQELLRDHDVVLFVNVKEKVMQRVARCTGADLLVSPDQLNAPVLGSCDNFRLEVLMEPDPGHEARPSPALIHERRIFASFNGCPLRRGCTLTVSGEPMPVLRRVKRVLKFAVYCQELARNEAEWLFDAGVQPPNPPPSPSLPLLSVSPLVRISIPKSVALSPLAPYEHQCLAFGCVAITKKMMDGLPLGGKIRYTLADDSTLAQFLDARCFDKHAPLGQTQAYLHNKTKLSVVVQLVQEELSVPPRIITWSWCTQCSVVGPAMELSRRSLRLSFGKFLELYFYSEGSTSFLRRCCHDATDHVRFFGQGHRVVRIECESVAVYNCRAHPGTLASFQPAQPENGEPDPPVVIYRDEPSSIIAFALSSTDYYSAINKQNTKLALTPSELDLVGKVQQHVPGQHSASPVNDGEGQEDEGSRSRSRLRSPHVRFHLSSPSRRRSRSRSPSPRSPPSTPPRSRSPSHSPTPSPSAAPAATPSAGPSPMSLPPPASFPPPSVPLPDTPPPDIPPLPVNPSNSSINTSSTAGSGGGGGGGAEEETDEAIQLSAVPVLTAAEIETVLKAPGKKHVKLKFVDDQPGNERTKFHCTVFCARKFHALRAHYLRGEKEFVRALSRCKRWEAKGGKSGAGFLKTHDNRFVLKKVSRVELIGFMEFSNAYFEYMAQHMFKELPSSLVKILGIYDIGFRNKLTRSDFIVVVMENLWYQQTISKIFDLKGSLRNRHVQDEEDSAVFLDENLLEFTDGYPLYVDQQSKATMHMSVWNDSLFLARQNVVDYSLLVGLDEDSHCLCVGIIDYMRQYTWDKRFESVVKSTMTTSGKAPTVISPMQYKQRFREAMDGYFMLVPDKFFFQDSVVKKEDLEKDVGKEELRRRVEAERASRRGLSLQDAVKGMQGDIPHLQEAVPLMSAPGVVGRARSSGVGEAWLAGSRVRGGMAQRSLGFVEVADVRKLVQAREKMAFHSTPQFSSFPGSELAMFV